MSIKAKLSFSISVIVAVILILSTLLYYFTTKKEAEANLEAQFTNIAKQISITVEASENARQYMENTLGDKLRIASLAAKAELDPDIKNVTNKQLVKLSAQLGVDHITLWQRFGNDVIAMRSSDPNEINLSSKTWDYWHVAFLQLFDKHEVDIVQGQKLKNFWSGPFNFSTSDPSEIRKWGSYYDGSTNYMINPYVNAQVLLDFDYTIGTDAIVNKIIADQSDILEVTGFDLEFYGKDKIIKYKQGIPVYNLDVRAIPFGDYNYQDQPNDFLNIQQVSKTGKALTVKRNINGVPVIKNFIPIKKMNKNYVFSVVFDQKAIQKPVNQLLIMQFVISLGLVFITLIASYFIAGFMLRGLNQVMRKVNAIASGDFGEVITIRSEDELGLLASRVDTMGSNLNHYTTQLKAAAEELQSTKQYLESFVNHTSDAIHVTDLEGHVIQVNIAFEKMYGWNQEEVLGIPLDNVPRDYLSSHKELEATVLRGGSVTDYETVRYTKSGNLIDLSITISPIRDELGTIIAIATISRNITSRKQTEEIIRRSEKLSVVGQIAAGVAHEVRNPLTTLRGFVQLHKQTGSLSPAHLEIMLNELDQINMIVSEFLVFAKPQATSYQPVNIIRLVGDIMMLLDSEAKMSNVQLALLAEAELPEVIGEANQLKQVFVNIMKNGIESMTGGGVLTVKVECAANDEIILQFIDQGCGIAESDLQRLGEPFFTKKTSGNGLGLMVSQQIIAAHKGTIVFHSELGSGTCVEITLPADS
ncbi:ATP-binding protein [Bacillus sp. FJAT-28004]|uniref:ATP-binding protein n=1 Tax=Bacillus sp. FJAT-28004 TaxID=1679165 RepID=UPI0006B63F9A|nr:ATP-binding protein [Bacillus sp. FJAT-28004]